MRPGTFRTGLTNFTLISVPTPPLPRTDPLLVPSYSFDVDDHESAHSESVTVFRHFAQCILFLSSLFSDLVPFGVGLLSRRHSCLRWRGMFKWLSFFSLGIRSSKRRTLRALWKEKPIAYTTEWPNVSRGFD